MSDISETVDYVSQLEENKFVRLLRHLLSDRRNFDGWPSCDQLNQPPIPLGAPNSELQLKIIGEEASLQSWATAWIFHVMHLPAFLWKPDVVDGFIKPRLRRAFEDLKDLPHPLSAFSKVFDPASRFRPIPEGYDYYIFTNVCLDIEEPFLSTVTEYAHECFEEIIGIPRPQHPTFGVGTPETICGRNRGVVRDLVVDLLNSPSGLYFVAREGQVSVAPITEHGQFLANRTGSSNDSSDEGLAAAAGSVLKDSTQIATPELFDLELLINSPNTREQDLQEFFSKNPHLLFSSDERYCDIRPHVCLYDGKGERLVPDFLAKVQDSDIWNVVELKLPSHPVVVGTGDKKRLAAAAARGVAELLRYRDFFSVRSNRDRVKKRFGIAPYEPTLALVIGRGRTTEHYEWRSMRPGHPTVKIVSYDDLFEQARRRSALLLKEQRVERQDIKS
jgi:hypothetical protein